MNLKPTIDFTDRQVRQGIQLSMRDGLATEAMTTFTGGTFLVAIAIYLGASNFQIGLLASLPTLTNVFQLAAIWLVQKYRNRRAIAVVSSTLARIPLLAIGSLPFLFSSGTSINTLIFLLVFHYFFGSMAGPGWNSWMKDLVPQNELGSFFSHRSRMMQILNVTLSFLLALVIDHVKLEYPQHEVLLYSLMFIAGGVCGLFGVYIVSKIPEPLTTINNEKIFKLISRPFKDVNFRKLLVFQVTWSFALNIATPFYSVYILKTIELPLSYLIGLNLLTQLSSIVSIKMWGQLSDRFSNKTILNFCAPIYAFCILAWPMASLSTSPVWVIPVLAFVHVITGLATAGINISLGNIGLKLAPKDEAIVYIVARSMTLASFSAFAPMVGGLLADVFENSSVHWHIEFGSVHIHLLDLKHWSFLFIIGSGLALLSLLLLRRVNEEGEVHKEVLIYQLKKNIAGSFWINLLKIVVFKPTLLFAYIIRLLKRKI